jgi:hypothetical protein
MILPCWVAWDILGRDEAVLAAAAIATLLLIHERRVMRVICDALLSFGVWSSPFAMTSLRSQSQICPSTYIASNPRRPMSKRSLR